MLEKGTALRKSLKNPGEEMNPNRTRLITFIALPPVFIRVRYNEVSQQVPHVWGISHSNHHKRDYNFFQLQVFLLFNAFH